MVNCAVNLNVIYECVSVTDMANHRIIEYSFECMQKYKIIFKQRSVKYYFFIKYWWDSWNVLGFEIWYSHNRNTLWCFWIDIPEARRTDNVLCGVPKRSDDTQEHWWGTGGTCVAYILTTPFYLNIIELDTLVLNIFCNKTVNPKATFLLKKIKKKCGWILQSKYMCFSISAGFEYVLVTEGKFAVNTCQRRKNTV